MATEADLNRIQRWMQACIVHQGDCEQAIASDAAQSFIPEAEARTVVKPSDVLSSLERLDIYRGMYLMRLEEAMEVDYPGLLNFLGQEQFETLIARFVDVNPSRSYTLNRLGDHFPEYLDSIDDLPKPEFCRALARLELALTQVFDEKETPALTQEAISGVPSEAWEMARLRPIAAFRLLALDYPASQYLGAIDGENDAPAIRKRKTYVAAYRRNYHVHRLDLTKPAYELLSALAAGTPLAEALAIVRARQSQLFGWFRDWVSEGLFQSVEIEQPVAAVTTL